MNKNVILLVSTVILLMSCNQTKKEEIVAITKVNKEIFILDNDKNSEGYTLMKNNCYVCHNPNTSSHDDILAPPFKAVKMHYTRQYNTKEGFVNAMTNWVQNPSKDNVLMPGAVNKFKIMPKLPLPTEDLEKIATYIYDNDVESPNWMGEHMKGNKKCNHKKGESCSTKC